MYNQNQLTWDNKAADTAKKATLGMIGCLLLSFIMMIVELVSASGESEFTEVFKAEMEKQGQSTEIINQLTNLIPTIRTVMIVFIALIMILFIALLWSKIKKLDNFIVPGRALYMFFIVIEVLGVIGIISNLLSGNIKEMIGSVLSIGILATAILAYLNIGTLKNAFMMAQRNAYMQSMQQQNMNMQNMNMNPNAQSNPNLPQNFNMNMQNQNVNPQTPNNMYPNQNANPNVVNSGVDPAVLQNGVSGSSTNLQNPQNYNIITNPHNPNFGKNIEEEAQNLDNYNN